MNLSEIETKIRAAVEAARASGKRIGRPSCDAVWCPMQCVAGVSLSYTQKAADILGVSYEWAVAFQSGYDWLPYPYDPEAHALGRKFRDEEDARNAQA